MTHSRKSQESDPVGRLYEATRPEGGSEKTAGSAPASGRPPDPAQKHRIMDAAAACPGLFPRILQDRVKRAPREERTEAAVAALTVLFREDEAVVELRRRYQLSLRQALLLRRLIAARGASVSISTLLAATGEAAITEETARKAINTLRRALPVEIRTVHGIGYALDEWRAVWPESCPFPDLPDDPALLP